METLKIIVESSWKIKDGEEFVGVLDNIGVLSRDMNQQTYLFIWYAFELFGFDTAVLDDYLTSMMQMDLKFAEPTKAYFKVLLYTYLNNGS